jgi:hypothetical protein
MINITFIYIFIILAGFSIFVSALLNTYGTNWRNNVVWTYSVVAILLEISSKG